MAENPGPESQEKQAWVAALRFLAATPKSRRDLFTKLCAKGFSEEVANQTLDGLEQKGLLSDKVFAKDLVARYTQGKPSGSRRIGFELQRRGIPPKVREEILSGMDPAEEKERARELSRAKLEQFKNLEPQKRKKRVFDFLLRRGFNFETVREVMEENESNQ